MSAKKAKGKKPEGKEKEVKKKKENIPAEELYGLENDFKPTDNLEQEYGMAEELEIDTEEDDYIVDEEEDDVFVNHNGGRGNDRYYVGRWLNRFSNITDFSTLNCQDRELIERLVEVVDNLNGL